MQSVNYHHDDIEGAELKQLKCSMRAHNLDIKWQIADRKLGGGEWGGEVYMLSTVSSHIHHA